MFAVEHGEESGTEPWHDHGILYSSGVRQSHRPRLAYMLAESMWQIRSPQMFNSHDSVESMKGGVRSRRRGEDARGTGRGFCDINYAHAETQNALFQED